MTALLAWTPLLHAQESKIGVAAATNSNKQNSNVVGEPPEGEKRIVEVGTNMLANERITTTANGQAQFLFNDGSSFSVGPDSDLTLDKFVYDPDKGTGEMSLSVTKGVLRFVGGKISKTNAVEVKAGVATMGIRGGIATFSFNPGQTATAKFLFGQQMTVTANGITQVTTRPGTAIDLPPGQPPQPPRTVSTQEMRQTMSSMEAKPASGGTEQGGGNSGGSGGSSNSSSNSGNQQQSSGGTQPAGGGSTEAAAPPPTQIESKLDSTGISSSNSVAVAAGPTVSPQVSASPASNPAPTTPTVTTTPTPLPVVAPVTTTTTFSSVRGHAFLQGGNLQPYSTSSFNDATLLATKNTTSSFGISGATLTMTGDTGTFNLDVGSGNSRFKTSLAIGAAGFTDSLQSVSLNGAAVIPAAVGDGLTGIKYDGYFNDNLSFFDNRASQADSRFNNPFTAINTSTPGANFDDTYSVRFFGFFRASETGNYRFNTSSDDSALLWLGTAGESVEALEARRSFSNLTVDNRGLHPVVSQTSGNIALVAGELYPILLYFGENFGGDVIVLNFRTPTGDTFQSDGTGFYFGGTGTPTPVSFDGSVMSGFSYRGTNPQDFLFYSLHQVSGSDVNRFTYFSGTPTAATAFPTSGFGQHTAFGQDGLFSVPFQGDTISGAPAFTASSILSRYSTNISAPESTIDDTRAVFAQASVGISGQGADQVSFLSAVTGIYMTSNSQMTAAGGMSGTAQFDASGAPVSLASHVAAAETDGNGSAIYGSSGQYMVFTADQLSITNNSGGQTRNTGAVSLNGMDGETANEFTVTGATGVTPDSSITSVSRSDRTIRGYVGGLVTLADGESGINPQKEAFASSLNGITVTTRSELNRASATIHTITTNTDLTLLFGSTGGTERNSAFINDNLIVMREASGSSDNVTETEISTTSALITHAVAPINAAAAFGAGRSFCTACSFIQWGWWSSDAKDDFGARANIHLATWVAGTLPLISEIPNTGTATYSGHAIGSVQNGSASYVAMGDFTKAWNFGTRTGTATISNFDSRNVSFATGSSNGREFTSTGLVTGSTSASITSGTLNGSFYRSATDPVAGAAGSFTFAGTNYRAAGTFVAAR